MKTLERIELLIPPDTHIGQVFEIKLPGNRKLFLQLIQQLPTEQKEDQTNFFLSKKDWEDFCKALDAPLRDIPALRKLLTEPGVFDER